MDLQKAANLAQILSLLGIAPASYCAYGTWVLLHPGGKMEVNSTVLLICFGAFIACAVIGGFAAFVSRNRRVVLPKKSDSSLAPYYGEDTGFRVESAMFGAPGIVPESVTSKVKLWLEKGNTSVPVSWQLLLDGRDPKPYAYKYLTVTVSVTEMEGKELAIPARTSAPEVSRDCVLPTRWKELTLQKSWYAPAKPQSSEVYRDKVGFIITNAGKSIQVWSPLWESADVIDQPPLKSLLRREGPKGWRAEDWEEQEHGCLGLESRPEFYWLDWTLGFAW